MLLIEAKNVIKHYGNKKIFEFENLKIYEQDKIGIVGENGAGKTTLLNILSKEEPFDCGEVNIFGEIAYIKQFNNPDVNYDNSFNLKTLKEFNVIDKLDNDRLSGGEQSKIKISSAISEEHHIVFADEPTANLDAKSVDIIIKKLKQCDSFLIVSHSPIILDVLCNKIIEVRNGKIEVFEGNYTYYKKELEQRKQKEQLKYEEYIKKKEQLELAAKKYEKFAKKAGKIPKRMGNSEARLLIGNRAEGKKHLEKISKTIKKRAERLDEQEKPKDDIVVKMDFNLTNPPQNKIVIKSELLSFSYNENVIFNEAAFSIENGKNVLIHGDNGTGKTTLLNLMHEGYYQIKVAPKAKIGYFKQSMEDIDNDLTILENALLNSVQKEYVVRSMLANLLFSAHELYKKGEVLSGGEKARLSLCKLFVSEYNIIFLDEPTNFLDVYSVAALKKVMKEYKGTIVLVCHDEGFSNDVTDKTIIIQNKKLIEFNGTPKEYKSQDKKSNIKVEKMAVEIKLNQIIFEISNCKNELEKEELENKYQELLRELSKI